MDNIRMEREKLLTVLRENREKHKADFTEAIEAWTKKATKALAKAAKKAEEKGEITIYPLHDLPKPENYIKSYDDAIARVEMDTRSELELDDRTFSAWVQDDWNWRGAFMASTSMYNNGR